MLKFISFGSGSSGNCYYLGTATDGLLIDIGVGIRTLKKHARDYGINLGSVHRILITHDHADHIKSVGAFSYDYNVPSPKTSCMGTVMPRSRVRIDEDGRVVCGGDTIMSGYADEPEMTASVLRGGEIYTADQGYIDSEGMLHLSGRMDDVINIGGYKVSPVEVEDAAYGFAQVKDCICVAHESDVWGVVLKLIVQTADGCALDRRGLARHLASRLERHKVPMVYEQADHIERTYNGKLNRKTYAEQK